MGRLRPTRIRPHTDRARLARVDVLPGGQAPDGGPHPTDGSAEVGVERASAESDGESGRVQDV